MKNILEHIMKAREEAMRRQIEANTIVIDKDIAYQNELYFENGIIRPAIFGLKIMYAEHLPNNANFSILNSDYLTDVEKKQQINEAKAVAFNIVARKNVDIGLLKYSKNAEHYNSKTFDDEITEEEYKLIKEALVL